MLNVKRVQVERMNIYVYKTWVPYKIPIYAIIRHFQLHAKNCHTHQLEPSAF